VQTARYEDEYDNYLQPDEPLPPSAAAITHRSPTMRYHRAATVDLRVRLFLSPPCLLTRLTVCPSACFLFFSIASLVRCEIELWSDTFLGFELYSYSHHVMIKKRDKITFRKIHALSKNTLKYRIALCHTHTHHYSNVPHI